MKTMATCLVLGGALLLGGCAGLRSVTSDVSSYGDWPAGRQPGTYAFERLPSQQARAADSDALEASARSALEQAGFQPAASGQEPAVLVQLGARDTRYVLQTWDDPLWWGGGFGGWRHGPWGGPRWGLSGRFGHGYGHGYGYGADFGYGAGFGYGWPPRTYHEREVAVLIRDRASGKPLYEGHASSDGSWQADGALLGAMFQATLADFPRPAINPRRVTVALPPS